MERVLVFAGAGAGATSAANTDDAESMMATLQVAPITVIRFIILLQIARTTADRFPPLTGILNRPTTFIFNVHVARQCLQSPQDGFVTIPNISALRANHLALCHNFGHALQQDKAIVHPKNVAIVRYMRRN